MMDDALVAGFDDVADSTDWLTTPLSGLAAVEAALRCQVCKDFYKTPMLTTCNHTFCSICIRRALSNDGKCPLCRASEQELRLRSNWSMEEAVEAFVRSRKDILDFARKPPETITIVENSTPKRGLEDDELDAFSETSREPKRIRTSARLSKTKGAEAMATIAREESELQEQSDPFDREPDYEPDDGLVACPICLSRMKAIQVDRHLDTSCPGSPQPQTEPQRSSSFQSARNPSVSSAFQPPSRTPSNPPNPSKKPERLPAINYSMLNEGQLRKKLAQLGISAGGGKQMMEKRHKEWITIWNANCDSLNPRKKSDLLHDLDVWERTLGSRAPTSSKSMNMGAQIKDKDFDGAAWAARHDNSFKDLIANARKNRTKVEDKVNETDAATTSAPTDPSIACRGDSGKLETDDASATPETSEKDEKVHRFKLHIQQEILRHQDEAENIHPLVPPGETASPAEIEAFHVDTDKKRAHKRKVEMYESMLLQIDRGVPVEQFYLSLD